MPSIPFHPRIVQDVCLFTAILVLLVRVCTRECECSCVCVRYGMLCAARGGASIRTCLQCASALSLAAGIQSVMGAK